MGDPTFMPAVNVPGLDIVTLTGRGIKFTPSSPFSGKPALMYSIQSLILLAKISFTLQLFNLRIHVLINLVGYDGITGTGGKNLMKWSTCCEAPSKFTTTPHPAA